MQGYGSGEENIVHVPASSVWEEPQRLESWARTQEPLRVGECCASFQQLLCSESFKTFLRIFNTLDARDAQQGQMYGWKHVTGEKMLQERFTRDRAYALWKNLQLQGKLDVLHALDDRMQKWMEDLDELEEQERDLQSRRESLGL